MSAEQKGRCHHRCVARDRRMLLVRGFPRPRLPGRRQLAEQSSRDSLGRTWWPLPGDIAEPAVAERVIPSRRSQVRPGRHARQQCCRRVRLQAVHGIHRGRLRPRNLSVNLSGFFYVSQHAVRTNARRRGERAHRQLYPRRRSYISPMESSVPAGSWRR